MGCTAFVSACHIPLYAVPQSSGLSSRDAAFHAKRAGTRADNPVPVQIHPVETREGGMALQFEHPTIAGVTVGGWMNRADAQPKIVQVCCNRTTFAVHDSACWVQAGGQSICWVEALLGAQEIVVWGRRPNCRRKHARLQARSSPWPR